MMDSRRVLYALTMASAMLVAWWLFRARRSKLALNPDQQRGLAVAGFIGAMLGAKAPFLLEADWESLRSGTVWLTDGKTIIGGIFGGYLAIEVTKWILGITTKTGDAFAVPIAAAIAIGRVGCFVAGCCFGTVTSLPWGCEFPMAHDAPGTLRHPTQWYEVLFHLSAAGLLLLAESNRWLPQQRLKAYLMAYLIYRFFSEWLRPEPDYMLGFTAYQAASVVLLAILGVLWYADARPLQSQR